MAVLYLGINNKSKQISQFYIGNSDKAKEVIRGYIGVEGKAKIFYESNLEKIYPTFKEGFPSSRTYQANRFYFSYAIDTIPSDAISYHASGNPSGTVIKYKTGYGSGIYASNKISTSVPYYSYYISTSRCFLNENSQNFFKPFSGDGKYQQPREALLGPALTPINIEYFLFNKVKNLYGFSSYSTGPTLTGNILHLNLDNIENLISAFAYMEKLTGNFICPSTITSLTDTYINCKNLIGPPLCTDKISTMGRAYAGCTNLNEANFHFYGKHSNYAFQNAKIYGNIYLHNTDVMFNYICDNRTNKDLQLNIYIRSSIPMTSIYKNIGYEVSSYSIITSKNWRLINGSEYSNVYINNSLTS